MTKWKSIENVKEYCTVKTTNLGEASKQNHKGAFGCLDLACPSTLGRLKPCLTPRLTPKSHKPSETISHGLRLLLDPLVFMGLIPSRWQLHAKSLPVTS